MTEAVQAVSGRLPNNPSSDRAVSPYEDLFVSRAIRHRMHNNKEAATPATFGRCRVSKDSDGQDGGYDVSEDPQALSQQGASPLLQKLRMTPALARVKEKLETQLAGGVPIVPDRENKYSPGLQRLRATPGRPVLEKRELLTRKHEEARNRADELNVGGGVTLWPHMVDMRLSRSEAVRLTAACLLLMVVTVFAFWQLHGSVLLDLRHYSTELGAFVHEHPIDTSSDAAFTASAVRWHEGFDKLLRNIGDHFDTTPGRMPVTYWLSVVAYVIGICTLLYYLAENVLSANKLSPRRIKQWVSLLSVIGCWTILMSMMFAAAYNLELAVADCVHQLSEQQRTLITARGVDTTVYDRVLSYWSTRHLSASSRGTLVIFGVLQFQSLVHYVQYYSLPIVTAVLTPLVKLVASLLTVYGLTAAS